LHRNPVADHPGDIIAGMNKREPLYAHDLNVFHSTISMKRSDDKGVSFRTCPSFTVLTQDFFLADPLPAGMAWIADIFLSR
jgi:hypothetical protein